MINCIHKGGTLSYGALGHMCRCGVEQANEACTAWPVVACTTQ